LKSVAIVGTGLIGASFGLALRRAGFDGTILGVSSEGALAGAVAAGAVDRGASLESALGGADLVFLSQTIGRILDTVRHIDPLLKAGALVTDAGSTKCEIVDVARGAITRGQFLGGHPMAGKETRGPAASDPELFRGRTWVLTPDDRSELETPAAREFRGWLDRIGTRVLAMDADEHDRVVARTSHLPQLASTALAALLADAAHVEVSGSGLADMTRLALSSYDLWRDILATNSDHIEKALGEYVQELEHIRENLRTRQLQTEFDRAAGLAQKVRATPPATPAPGRP
jgi:prephenate dehydrogenase